MQKKKHAISPESIGMWNGCKGEWYSAGGKCRTCGRTRIDHLSAVIQPEKPKRSPVNALDEVPQIKKSLLSVNGALRVSITRGYRGIPLDYDNLVASCKALRDQIAEKILGLANDAESDKLVWEYKQKQGQGVLVEIFSVSK